VVTGPAHVAQWFGQRAQIDPRPAGATTLGRVDLGDVHGVVEPTGFAFRCNRELRVPYAPGDSTVVETTLSAEDGYTRRLVESGSAAEDHRNENGKSWIAELTELAER
jgi:hypothetical protein